MAKNNATTRGGFHYAYLIVLSCIVITCLPCSLVLSCAGIFFTPVSEFFGMPKASFTLYFSRLNIAMMATLPVAGKLLAAQDSRLVLSVATALCNLGMFGMTSCQQIWQFYLVGVVLGIGVEGVSRLRKRPLRAPLRRVRNRRWHGGRPSYGGNALGARAAAGGAFYFGVVYAMTTVETPLLVRSVFGSADYANICSRVSMVGSLMSAVAAVFWSLVIDSVGGYGLMFVLSLACRESPANPHRPSASRARCRATL